MAKDNLTLEEKVDKILKYQTKMYRWQVAKSIINFILFFVLVVLPIIWLFYWIKSVDFSSYIEMLENVKSASGSMDKINDLLRQIPN
jgi:cytochrome c biogenesis protein CcdA